MDAIDRFREEEIADWLIEDIPDLDVNSDVSDHEEELQPQNKVDIGLDLSGNSLHNIVRNVIKADKAEEPEHASIYQVTPQENHNNDRPSSSRTENCSDLQDSFVPKPSTSKDISQTLFANNFDSIFNQLIIEEVSNYSNDKSNTDIEVGNGKQSEPRPSTSETNYDPGKRPKELKVTRKRPSTKKNLSIKIENRKKVGLAANKCQKVADNKHRKGTKDLKKQEAVKQKRDAINSLWRKKDLQTSVPPYEYSAGKKSMVSFDTY